MAQLDPRTNPNRRVTAATRTRPVRRPVFADPLTYVYAVAALLFTGLAEGVVSDLLSQLHL